MFEVIKRPNSSDNKLVVFAIVKDEMYFLPHFLAHYRRLGAKEFWFLDDNSTDGTREFIAQTPDCGLLLSNYTFSDQVQGRRFVVALRNAVPEKLFLNRWVLTVDADEFLIMPPEFTSLEQLLTRMEANKLSLSRALMVDFYPRKLSDLDGVSYGQSPFMLSQYFDTLSSLRWEDGEPAPQELSYGDSVRPRMFLELQRRGKDLKDSSYRVANLNKVPLIYWQEGTNMVSVHRCNRGASAKIQLALAHFKFYPGYLGKIQQALRTKAYWNGSIEYQFLAMAASELADWQLTTSGSKRFVNPESMEKADVIWSRLS